MTTITRTTSVPHAAGAGDQNSDTAPVTHLKCEGGDPVLAFKAGPNAPRAGKWFFKCPKDRNDATACKFFFPADADLPRSGVPLRCDCGNVVRMKQSGNGGMEHNRGAWFATCRREEAEGKCSYWRWADGSRPGGESAQRRFNDWMGGGSSVHDDEWEWMGWSD